MKTYKLKIKITSSLGTPPAADTIWGHICWAIRYSEGADALEEFLQRYDDSPPLILSDPFPEGLLPAALLPNFRAETDKQIAFDTIKKLNKSSLVPLAFYEKTDIVSKVKIIEYLSKCGEEPRVFTKATIAHNTINRLTGGVLEKDQTLPEEEQRSGLFFTEEYHVDTANPPVMDIYVLSEYSPERLLELFNAAFMCGYGKYASRGKGRIETAGIEEVALPAHEKPNAVMLLASCLPAETDPTQGYWQLFTRYGKLGGHFANGPMTDLEVDENLPFKKPVTMLKAGSVLKTDSPPPYCGCVRNNVHAAKAIRHYGMAPALPINCDLGGQS
jgi:CRISPR-associated protein Csm4